MTEDTMRGAWLFALLFVCTDCAGPPFSAEAASETVAGSGGAAGPSDAMPTASVAGQGGSPAVISQPSQGGSGGSPPDISPHTGGANGEDDEDANQDDGSAGANGGSAGTGTDDTTAACPAPAVGALRVAVCQENEDPFAPGDHASREPHPFLLLTNDGPNIQLSRIKVRYFFSAEVSGTWQAGYFWATNLNGAPFDPKRGFAPGPLLNVEPWSPAQPDADHRLELSFDSASPVVLSPGKSLEVRVWFRTDADGQLLQGDDWSYVPLSTPPQVVQRLVYRESAHIALYVDDQLVWGAEPCSLNNQPGQASAGGK
jgi:hypothetical protein